MVSSHGLRYGLAAAVAAASLTIGAPAAAYALRSDAGRNGCDPENSDGTACRVFCDNGQLAGVMYWNGTVWTDGVRSDTSQKIVARAICAAQGTACT